MKPKAIFSFVLKIVVLTVLMFVLFSTGSTLTGMRASASQLTPAEMTDSFIALLAVCLVDTILLSYFIVRSRLHGWKLAVVVAVLYYGIKTFESQLETWYFMRNVTADMLPKLFMLTVPVALVLPPVAVFLFGKWRAADQQDTSFTLPANGRLWKFAVLAAVVYPVLFFGFGYMIAWQSPAVREFYGGTDTGNIITHYINYFSSDHLVYFFEILRGLLWAGLGALILRSTKASLLETAILAGLMFALIENNQHWLPNPLMPTAVRTAHFIETASENFILGLATTGLLLWQPKRQPQPERLDTLTT